MQKNLFSCIFTKSLIKSSVSYIHLTIFSV
nr:MAG TPA: hypothetical protein [Caudoviricetes sp.]